MSSTRTEPGTAAAAPVHRRTAVDVVLGLLLVFAGLVVLGEVTVAAVVSVRFLGWTAAAAGVVLIGKGLMRRTDGTLGWALTGGALLLLLGISFLRHPGMSLLSLTLVAGPLLMVNGVNRALAGRQSASAERPFLVASGLLTLLLGAVVFFGWPGSSLWFLGTVLGVECVFAGLTMILVGRRPARAPQL